VFVRHSEDKLLRNNTKWHHYNNERIVMWDNTNIPFIFKPSTADNQRRTYSAYYAGNVAKGAVFCQPCGWMGTHDLWEGSVSDTAYMENSGILDIHTTYISKYDSEDADATWTIIVDKGYRVDEAAWNNGQQIVMQPPFHRSDVKFCSYDVLRASAIAHNRSGNERVVNYAKKSDYVRSGLHPHECPKRLDKVWKAWGFQCNFMYKPVL
jgi:DDE superfamily endonuclease